jgi:hypothetical protein
MKNNLIEARKSIAGKVLFGYLVSRLEGKGLK